MRNLVIRDISIGKWPTIRLLSYGRNCFAIPTHNQEHHLPMATISAGIRENLSQGNVNELTAIKPTRRVPRTSSPVVCKRNR